MNAAERIYDEVVEIFELACKKGFFGHQQKINNKPVRRETLKKGFITGAILMHRITAHKENISAELELDDMLSDMERRCRNNDRNTPG